MKALMWCSLNAEQDALEQTFKERCVSVRGNMPNDAKEQAELLWREGDVPIMISKPECLGWGMNWQHCHDVVFVGADHSFEAWYQAVRRCHRFGQQHPVRVHLIRTSADGRIAHNLERKRLEHEAMVRALVAATSDGAERRRVTGGTRELKLPAFMRDHGVGGRQ